MTREQRRRQRIADCAYFLSEQRRRNGVPGTPEGDWLAAEQEQDRQIEAEAVLQAARKAATHEQKIYLFVLYYFFMATGLRPSAIRDDTPLPKDWHVRRELVTQIGWETLNSYYSLPRDVANVGMLVEALAGTHPVDHGQFRRYADFW